MHFINIIFLSKSLKCRATVSASRSITFTCATCNLYLLWKTTVNVPTAGRQFWLDWTQQNKVKICYRGTLPSTESKAVKLDLCWTINRLCSLEINHKLCMAEHWYLPLRHYLVFSALSLYSGCGIRTHYLHMHIMNCKLDRRSQKFPINFAKVWGTALGRWSFNKNGSFAFYLHLKSKLNYSLNRLVSE